MADKKVRGRDKVIETSDKFLKVFNFVLAMRMTLW